MRSGNGPGYADYSSALRFTAPSNGEYTVDALMYGAFVPRTDAHDDHENCTVKVGGIIDQAQEVTGYYYANTYDTLTSTQFAYSKALSLTAGETVDFLVTHGSSGGYAQSAGAQITITPTPEPGTLVLLVTGLLGLLTYAWRKRK